MIIQFTTVTEQQQGPDVHINCPACGIENVPASSFESTEVAKLFFFIPILRLRNTWLTCKTCGQKLVLSIPITDLGHLSVDMLTNSIRYKASPAAKVMAILSFITCLFPIIGVIFAGIACFLSRGTKGWAKGLSVTSLILAIVFTLCMVIGQFI